MARKNIGPIPRICRDGRLSALQIDAAFDPAAAAGRFVSGALPPSAGQAPAWLHDALAAFFARQPVCLPPAALDLDRFGPFAREVLLFLTGIPVGRVASYGAVAAAVGRPRAARAVGSALAANPFPLLLPCHRVVPGDGTVGSYNRHPDSPLKRRLLVFEGVVFTPTGRIAPAAFYAP